MRTFVAVEITDQGVINKIEKLQSQIRINAKPVDVKNIHFTLQFLGEITESNMEEIQKALKSIEFESFMLEFRGIGAFPKPKFPRVVWVGTDENGGEQLRKLSEQVENALSPLGFKKDKAFKPHVTIFRIKKKVGDISKDLESFENMSYGSQKITQIKFKKSILTPNGPVYSDLMEVNAIK